MIRRNRQGTALLHMLWRDCAFAHWRADAERIARVLPEGVALDRFGDDAWLSVVPFRLSGVRARFAPVLPGMRNVAEINLRTYVRVGALPGIWFFSLDADSPLLVQSARLTTSLPYFRARIASSERDGRIDFASERTDGRGGPGRFRAQFALPAAERCVEPASLLEFLHERYRFFTQRGTQLVTGEVRHSPWTLGEIVIDVAENTLGERIGHPLAGPPDLAFFARGQAVRASAVRTIMQGSA